MLSSAKAKYLRLSARKTRLVLDLIKGKDVESAGYILDHMNKRASGPIKKVLDSAFANANFEKKDKFLSKDLVVSGARVDGGPTYRRYRAATMGRATSIRHRTSHICLELEKKAQVEKVTKNKSGRK